MKTYVDAAKLLEYTTKLVAKLKTIFPTSPLVASTAAGMTDTSRTYVYTGSETGYTAGHWYYYDPTDEEWKDGGVYQSSGIETDTTLSVSDMAADAKATGDAIADAKAAVLAEIAPAYSSSATYAVGDYVIYNLGLYRCTTAITTAEAWTSGHWAQVDLAADVADLKKVVTDAEEALSQEVNATQTAVNNKYVGQNGGFGSSTDFVTYTFPLNGAVKIRVETGNYSTGTRTVYTCAFSSGETYDTSNVISVKDAMAPGTANAIYEYDVPNGAKSAAISGSKSRPEGANAPNAQLIFFVDCGELANTVADLGIDVNNLNGKLKQTQNIKSQFISGGYIDLSVGLGNTVDTTPVENGGWDYIIVPCHNKDIFTLKGSGGNSPRLWGFCNNEYKLLSVANPNVSNLDGDALILTASSDGYFISNTQAPSYTTLTINTVMTPASVPYVNELVNAIQPSSDYRKNVKWASSDLADYIHVSHGQFDIFTSSTTASDVYALYHTLTENSDEYVTETELGLSSDGVNKLYSYTFKPVVTLSTELPKLFIISGQHGFEKGPVFGLYYFLRELVNNYKDNTSLSYLHNWCEIIVIPLMNPYGFNNDDYENYNDVNLNRNWPVPGWSSANKGGTTAGDQPETQLAKAVLDENLDAFWFTDFHSNGQGAVGSYYSCLWHAFGTIIKQDDYTKIGIMAAEKHICDISGRFYLDYTDDCPTYTQSGHLSYTTNYSVAGLAANYARYKGVQGETMEGFDAWPDGTRYTPSCHQANADIIANWMRAVLAAYERLGGNS